MPFYFDKYFPNCQKINISKKFKPFFLRNPKHTPKVTEFPKNIWYFVTFVADYVPWLKTWFLFSSINIAKGTADPRVEFISQDHSSKFTNLEHITISASRLTSKSQPNISISTKYKVKILTKPSFRILTKIQLGYLNLNISSKILNKKLQQKLSFMTKPQLPNL